MCDTSELCAPLFRPEPKFGNHVSMVLVQPVPPSETWNEVIESTWADDYRKYVPSIILSFQTTEIIVHCICIIFMLET